jgi:hypothetical protein
MRSRIILTIWLVCILFPLAWIGRVSDGSKQFMDWLLEPEWLHVVMHFVIYAGLAILLSSVRQDGPGIPVVQLIAVVLVVGFFQELLQYLSDAGWFFPRSAVLDSIFDLGVDLAGALTGLALFNRFSIFRRLRLPETASDYAQD